MKKFYLVALLASKEEDFIGDLHLILNVNDREEAYNIIVAVRRCLKNKGIFKLLGQI